VAEVRAIHPDFSMPPAGGAIREPSIRPELPDLWQKIGARKQLLPFTT